MKRTVLLTLPLTVLLALSPAVSDARAADRDNIQVTDITFTSVPRRDNLPPVEVVTVTQPFKVWSNRKYEYEVPAELVGTRALRVPLIKTSSTLTFTLDKPARFYVQNLLKFSRIPEAACCGKIPDAWKLYSTDFLGIHYLDLPAGKNEITVPCGYSNVGIVPLDALMPREKIVLRMKRLDGNYHSEPGHNVTFGLVIDNGTGAPQRMTFAYKIRNMDNEVVISDEVPFTAAAGASQVRAVFEKPDTGYYRVTATAVSESLGQWNFSLPIAVFTPHRIPEDPNAKMAMPFGVYTRREDGTADQVLPHLHWICNDLASRGINTLTVAGLTKEELDLVGSYGMSALYLMFWSWPDELVQHPVVIACMYGDEPTVEALPTYVAAFEDFAASQPDVPLLTCLIGEHTTGPRSFINIWSQLKPRVRLIRYYPIRKARAALLHYIQYKNWFPPRAVYHLIEESGEAPWWCVVQAFGGLPVPKNPAPYWRRPNDAELTGQVHLALAHGADGILAYIYNEGNNSMVNQETLKPIGSLAETYGALARQTTAAAELLKNRKIYGPFYYEADNIAIECVGGRIDSKPYLYLVNLDTEKPQPLKLLLSPGKNDGDLIKATDVYTGRSFELAGGSIQAVASVESEATGTRDAQIAQVQGKVLTVTMQPGEGLFLKFE